MTSLLARLGHSFDTRWAAQTFLSTAARGKRKRGSTQGTQRVCAECRSRNTGRAGEQRRSYNDGSIRLGAAGYLFPAGDAEVDGSKRRGDWGFNGNRYNEEEARDQPVETTTESNGLSRSEHEREDMWEQFEVANEDEVVKEGISAPVDTTYVQDEREVDIARDQALLNLDYKAELSGALLRAETDLVMRCLFAANQANDLDFIRAIPPTAFSEVIRLAQPRRFVSSLGSAHLELSTWMVKQMHIAPMRQVAFEYASVIRQLLGIRKSAGIKLTLGDYTLLLRAARDLGNQRMGRLLWSNMLEEGYKPTTQCYNYMMATIVWNGIHSAGGRQKVRVIPFNMLGRRQQTAKRYHGYSVGPSGVRQTVLSIFNEMLANEAYADLSSFRIVMTASAREGDLETVKSILMKVWNIDVDGIMAGKPESDILPKERPDHSPLRPTEDFLFTLAHIFGINNDISTALRVVDFVARHFNLQVDQQTWNQLFEWTFVLAMDRLNAARRRGTDVGNLPPQSLVNLWNTMISPPYNFKPTMGMYNHMIKHMFRNRWVPEMALKMEEARSVYARHRQKAYIYYRNFKRAVGEQRSKSNVSRSDYTLDELRQGYEQADLKRQRDFFWLKRWVRLFLGVHNHHIKSRDGKDSAIRRLPRLLWTWRKEAPATVRYEIRTGWVEIEFRDEESLLQNSKNRFNRSVEVHKVLDNSRKLVGQRWIRGGAVKKDRRLLEHEQKIGAEASISE